MSPFTGTVFFRPDGLGGVNWHRRHHTRTAVAERITAAQAAVYFGGRSFARMAFARVSAAATDGRMKKYLPGDAWLLHQGQAGSREDCADEAKAAETF